MEALEILLIVLLCFPMLVWLHKSMVCSQFSLLGKVRMLRGSSKYSVRRSWLKTSFSSSNSTDCSSNIFSALHLPLQFQQKQVAFMKCFCRLCWCWRSPAEFFPILWGNTVRPERLLASYILVILLTVCICICAPCGLLVLCISFFLLLQVVQDWPPSVKPKQGKCKPVSHMETNFASNAIPVCFSREI